MSPHPSQPRSTKAADHLAAEIFAELRRRFPISLASDEFHYFPQVRPHPEDLQRWDDFSEASVGQIIEKCAHWSREASRRIDPREGLESQTDLNLLKWVLTVISEQLKMAQPHTTQPTFYLTLAGIGLAQVYGANPSAWHRRLHSFPGFLRSAQAQIGSLPKLFQARGLKMAEHLTQWVSTLDPSPGAETNLNAALQALESFQAHLRRVPTRNEFRLPKEVYARIAGTHLGIDLSLKAVAEELESELAETQSILRRESAHLAPGRTWQETVAQLGFHPAADGESDMDGYGIYRRIITQLERHCIAQGLITEREAAASPVTVAAVPDYLIPMRSAAAYSMAPGHPAAGGTFYLLPGDLLRRPAADIHLLSAHETYPGHHLLDTARWNLSRPWRRQLEFPLFYEGWASFAEELLFETGFCSGFRDRLLMAKRRYYRALRGKTDLMLNQGVWQPAAAADYLHQRGYPRSTAEGMVTRYALKPGYQLCYSLGRRRFRGLYDRWRAQGGRLQAFCARVLSGGEVHLNDLKQRFQGLN